MNFASIEVIRQSGFDGFVTISALKTSKCSDVPTKPGVYLILKPNSKRPDFLSQSIGGYFKRKDLTVAVSELVSGWRIPLVLNIGKAGPKATLQSRLKDYMRFGQGEAVGHQGGRYIWQLAHSGNTIV